MALSLRNAIGALLILCMAAIAMPACGGAQGQATAGQAVAERAKLVMYGSSRCGICHHFRRKMAKEGIDYTFVDVNRDPEGKSAMWQHVMRVRPKARSVRFPVFAIGQRALVSPSYAQFREFYASR